MPPGGAAPGGRAERRYESGRTGPLRPRPRRGRRVPGHHRARVRHAVRPAHRSPRGPSTLREDGDMVAADPRRRRSDAAVAARSVAVLRAPAPYDRVRTRACGQAFGWQCESMSAARVFAGRRVTLRQLGEEITV